jgi:hypothetical protein
MSSASAMAMPNLFSLRPVEMYGWVPASTSGLTRSEIGANAQLGGDHLQALQLVGGFDVEAVHADFQGAAHVFTGLADAGEHHVGTPASGQYTLQLATGDDVETGAQARQHIQHAQVGVGLDREAHQVLVPCRASA